jgi:lysophospholipase L1-like esterase
MGKSIEQHGSWRAVITISGLSFVASASTWKMFQFRGDLHAITENTHWEQRLEAYGVYRQGAILFFGDSEVAQWPMAKSFGILPIRNRGIKGGHLHLALGRYEEALQQMHPRLVVVEIGINDLGHAQPMETYLAEMDRVLSESPRTVLCSLLPTRGEFVSDHPLDEIRRWNAHLKSLAAQHSVPFVDFYSLLADEKGEFRTEFTQDGLHPNEAGYVVMTEAIMRFLN